MKPLLLPRSSGFKPIQFKVLTVLLFALACAHAVAQLSGLSGYELHSPKWPYKEVHESVQLADTDFNIPHSMVERPEQLQPDASSGKVAMRVLWPEMTGYRKRLSDFFQDKHHERKFIDMELEHKRGAEGMGTHLDTVYKRLARGQARNGPAGLRILTLSGEKSPYLDQVYFEPGKRPGFVARCRTRQTGSALKSARAASVCRRTIKMGDDLLLSYTFPRSLLAKWGQLDLETRRLFNSLRAEPQT